MERHFKTILRKTGLPETTRFHDLRHSGATLLIAQGVHLSMIKDILGHTQISTTADIYGHVLPEIQRKATAKLDLLLSERDAEQAELDEFERIEHLVVLIKSGNLPYLTPAP